MTAQRSSERIPRRLVLLMAVACGATVANLYYVQPLLNVIAHDLGVSDGAAGLLVTCAQVGYALGLALLVPLGDLLERRRLMTTMLVGAAATATVCATAPSFPVLAVGLVATGSLSVVTMILVPLAASLAGPQERGQVVGTVMSGLLVGILISRTLSGLIAALGGWRLTFVFAAALMLVLAVALRRGLPVVAPTERLRYRALLRSVLALVAAEPILRRRMLFGAFAMAGFSVLWTSIAFLLAGPPYGYGEGVIGLFGLAGLAGALIAPVAGRLADRGHTRLALGGALSATLASWILLDLGRSSLAALIAGIVLLDLGIQATHINNQSAVYRLHPEARSRLTTAYMVAYFTGGVLGSTLASTIYASSGWTATCLLGAAPALAGLVVWLATQGRSRVSATAPTTTSP